MANFGTNLSLLNLATFYYITNIDILYISLSLVAAITAFLHFHGFVLNQIGPLITIFCLQESTKLRYLLIYFACTVSLGCELANIGFFELYLFYWSCHGTLIIGQLSESKTGNKY